MFACRACLHFVQLVLHGDQLAHHGMSAELFASCFASSVSEDGHEMTWAVNVLAPYLLTALLLDRVKSRIVNASSLSACNTIDFDNLQQEQGYRYPDVSGCGMQSSCVDKYDEPYL